MSGGTATKLNSNLMAGADMFAFTLSADGSTVVYRAGQETDGVTELYRLPMSGGPVTKLNPTLVEDGDVFSFKLSADGDSVVYRADQDTDGVIELSSVPVGGGDVIKLNQPLVVGRNVSSSFTLSADGSTVYYENGSLYQTNRSTRAAGTIVAAVTEPPQVTAPADITVEGDITTTSTVTVQDTTPPSISAPNDVTVESIPPTGTPVSLQAIADFLSAATTADSVDTAPVIFDDAPNTFPIDATTVTFTATDAAGNSTTAMTNVIVVDTTAPTLTAPSDISVQANVPTGAESTLAAIQTFLAGATATDNRDAGPTITSVLPAVLPLGATTVTFTATDASGNSSTATAHAITGVKVIDIRGTGANTLTLTESNLAGIPDSGQPLWVMRDIDDTLNFVDGDFRITGSFFSEGQFVVQAQSGQTTIEVEGLTWTNPIIRLDVNNSGTIEPIDALQILSQLNRQEFVIADTTTLDAPGNLSAPFPLRFYDTSADGNLTPIDALRVLNGIFRGEGEGERQASPLSSPSILNGEDQRTRRRRTIRR